MSVKLSEEQIETLVESFMEVSNEMSKLPISKQLFGYPRMLGKFFNSIFLMGYSQGKTKGIEEGRKSISN